MGIEGNGRGREHAAKAKIEPADKPQEVDSPTSDRETLALKKTGLLDVIEHRLAGFHEVYNDGTSVVPGSLRAGVQNYETSLPEGGSEKSSKLHISFQQTIPAPAKETYEGRYLMSIRESVTLDEEQGAVVPAYILGDPKGPPERNMVVTGDQYQALADLIATSPRPPIVLKSK